MVTERKKTIEFIKLSILSCIVCIINCFFYSNRIVMYTAVTLEVVWLLSRLILGRYTQYYSHYIIFMALSLEFPEFVGTDSFFGFKTIGLGSINIGVIMILPLFITLLCRREITINRKNHFDRFFKNLTIIVLAAFVLGILHWLLNDNGIANVATVNTFVSYMYHNIYLYFCFFTFFLLSKTRSFDTDYIENSLLSMIVAVACTMVLSLVFSNYGVYGGVKTLQICNLNMVFPCCIVVFVYKKINKGRRVPVFISAVTLSLLSLMYNTNGKTVLSLGVSIIFLLVALYRRSRVAFWFTILAIPAILFGGLKILEQLSSKFVLLSIKLEQALSMIAFWRAGWISNISQSPVFRIQEFITIVVEYIRKPWDFLFGKGYMGSTLDNLGYFSVAHETTFSQFELENHIYISMHETLNSIFLMSGLYGLFFYIKYILKGIKSVQTSFWGVIATFWFGLFFNYSITIAAFGVAAFGMALLSLDKENEVLLV